MWCGMRAITRIMQQDRGTFFQRQLLPVSLTAVIAVLVIALIYSEILLLNRFTGDGISLAVRWPDILIGLTVYLKTSIDFALFMGNLMQANGGWRNRISIEIGTALGHALGTMAILFIWALFREIDWLLAIMILLAAVILLRLAEDGLVHAVRTDREYPTVFRHIVHALEVFLKHVNWFTRPLLARIFPDLKMNAGPRGGFWALMLFSFSVPFVLGLDDFAGYVPLFSIVNVFGFAIGAFVAHALLNAFLYLSPERTTRAVRNPVISLLGSVAFIGIAGWGVLEALRLFALI